MYDHIVKEEKDGYTIQVDSLPEKESLVCADNKDMIITKEQDSSIILSIKSFSKKPFQKN